MGYRVALAALCGAALVFLAACGGSSGGGDSTPGTPTGPAAPTGVAATTGNAQVTLSWPAVPAATSYNIYSSPSMPVTTAGTKASAAAPGATLSALTNGTPVFAAVTAISAAGESALSNTVCAVPTAASTTGLTLYDPLCGGTLDGTKWQTPQLSRGVGNSAMELGTQISNMESRTIQFLSYQTLLNVNSASRIPPRRHRARATPRSAPSCACRTSRPSTG